MQEKLFAVVDMISLPLGVVRNVVAFVKQRFGA